MFALILFTIDYLSLITCIVLELECLNTSCYADCYLD